MIIIHFSYHCNGQSQWAFAVDTVETGDVGKIVSVNLEEDLSKFRAKIEIVENIVKGLEKDDKRITGTNMIVKLIQNHLEDLKTKISQIVRMKNNYLAYQHLVNKVYFDFKTTNENDIKSRNKIQALESSLEEIMKKIEKDTKLVDKLELIAHKEIECRRNYVTKLQEILESNTKFGSVAQAGELCGNLLKIDNQLKQITILSTPQHEIQTNFGENLKKLLYQA